MLSLCHRLVMVCIVFYVRLAHFSIQLAFSSIYTQQLTTISSLAHRGRERNFGKFRHIYDGVTRWRCISRDIQRRFLKRHIYHVTNRTSCFLCIYTKRTIYKSWWTSLGLLKVLVGNQTRVSRGYRVSAWSRCDKDGDFLLGVKLPIYFFETLGEKSRFHSTRISVWEPNKFHSMVISMVFTRRSTTWTKLLLVKLKKGSTFKFHLRYFTTKVYHVSATDVHRGWREIKSLQMSCVAFFLFAKGGKCV